MKSKMLPFRLFPFLLAGIFFIGCYTQLGTVKKEHARYSTASNNAETYEPEYGEAVQDTVYVEEEEPRPVYQYNFYGWPYSDFDLFVSPFYSGISFYFGAWDYDPFFYDPWFYRPGFVSIHYWDPWFGPGHYFWRPSYRWGHFLGYGGYFGYASAYYGPYDPYWDYLYSSYYYYSSTFEPQRRRDFDFRRGLEDRTANSSGGYYMPAMASGGKNTSKIQRVRKTKPVTSQRDAITVRARQSKIRTVKAGDERTRTLTTKPVTRVTSSDRVTRSRKIVRSSSSEATNVTSSRSVITRSSKSVPNVIRSKPQRTRSPKSVSTSRSSRSTKKYTPSRTTRTQSSGTQYKPSTSRSTRSSSVSRSTQSTTTKNSGSSTTKSSGSSSRTKKK